MFKRRGDRNDNFESSIFLVLVILIICSFSNNSEKHIANADQYKITYELHSDVSAINEAQIYSFQKSLIPIISNKVFNFSDEKLNIITKSLISQKFRLLKDNGLIIRSIISHKFYIHFQHIDNEYNCYHTI